MFTELDKPRVKCARIAGEGGAAVVGGEVEKKQLMDVLSTESNESWRAKGRIDRQ